MNNKIDWQMYSHFAMYVSRHETTYKCLCNNLTDWKDHIIAAYHHDATLDRQADRQTNNENHLTTKSATE